MSGSGANLPEVVRHPSLVRAAVSPTAAVVTAAGVGIGVVDHSVVLAVVLGVGAWCGRMVVAAITRARRDRAAQPRPAEPDPWSVPEPWRQLVRQALNAQSQFDRAVDDWPPGPIQDRLVSMRPRVYAHVDAMGVVARQGAALSGWSPGGTGPGGASRPSAEKLAAELHQVETERRQLGGRAPERQAALDRSEEAVAAQLRSVRSSEAAAAGTHDRLRVLVARLDDAVTSLLMLGTGAPSGSGPDAFAASLDQLTEEITALHQGLADSIEGPQAPPSAPTP